MCSGGGPSAPPPPPPPPQLAKAPDTEIIRKKRQEQMLLPGKTDTLLTGGQGVSLGASQLGGNSLLGGGTSAGS